MKLLIHVCCAHCLGKLLAGLKTSGLDAPDPIVFWFNPNIHPLLEYRRRLKAVKMLCERAHLTLRADERYGLVDFCRAVNGHEEVPERCKRCYGLRLARTALEARVTGCNAFTTTLVTSLHQDHQQICAAGNVASSAAGVEFIYRDWRHAEADERLVKMLYHQSYCGCIFSEYDRYCHTTTHLWPPAAARTMAAGIPASATPASSPTKENSNEYIP